MLEQNLCPSSDNSEFEQNLIELFEKHHKTGSRWYPHPLKEKIFEAFELGFTVNKIIEICEAPSFLIYKWYGNFMMHKNQISAPSLKNSNFREIHILKNPNSQKNLDIEEDLDKPNAPHEPSSLRIQFPNGIQLFGNEKTFTKHFLNDLFCLGA